MISSLWIRKRKPHWERLERLLEIAGAKGISALTRDEMRELGLLYRQVAADLAALREDPSSVHFARYLNQLLARTHNIIYTGQKASPSSALAFLVTEYPQVFRRNASYCVVAFLVFLTATVAGSLGTLQDQEFQHKMLGPHMVETIERKEMWTHSIVTVKPLASSAIMTNNLSVAFTTFALGITAGLGTLYMMAMNGLLFGVVATSCWLAGMSVPLWSFVIPHGVLELPAIFIAGGAGLLVARGLLFPGMLPRKDSLAVAGGEAARLLVGAIPMLVVAGVIEGFVSPTELSASTKFALGVLFAIMLAAYLGMSRGKAKDGSLPSLQGTSSPVLPKPLQS
ncbi:MAG: stage II sporulation protein M [Candidatus Korobacteraceae bacterium]